MWQHYGLKFSSAETLTMKEKKIGTFPQQVEPRSDSNGKAHERWGKTLVQWSMASPVIAYVLPAPTTAAVPGR